MVTHDALSASYADRQVFLSDGHIIEELRNATQDELLQTMARIYPRHDTTGVIGHPRNGKRPELSENDTAPVVTPSFVEWNGSGTNGGAASPRSPIDDVALDGHPEHAIFRDGGGGPQDSGLEDDDEFEQTTPRRALLG